jgi:pimeloyl-ACP methyl ester carboxylesterase
MKKSNIEFNTWFSHIKEKGLRSFLADTIETRFDVSHVDAAFVEWFLDEAAKNDPEFIARFVTLMASVDLQHRLGEICCPTLVVVPGNDPLGPLNYYQIFRDCIPKVTFIVYDDLPHNITDAVPERCAEELKRFLLKQSKTVEAAS